MPTDEELVRRAQAGDVGAFEDLVRRHADRLYAVLLRFTASGDEAEEAMQEAFVRAWRGIAKFDGRSAFFTWLYRIGINEAKRRASRQPPPGAVVSAEEHPVEGIADTRPAPEARAEQRELRDLLEEAIRDLPLDYRIPLVLRDIEGLSTKEAAAATGLREGAFKSRLHRARMRIREQLAPYLDQEEERAESPGPVRGSEKR